MLLLRVGKFTPNRTITASTVCDIELAVSLQGYQRIRDALFCPMLHQVLVQTEIGSWALTTRHEYDTDTTVEYTPTDGATRRYEIYPQHHC